MATLRAVLIGINEYRQNKLSGCINDVLAMDSLFRDLCRQQSPPMNYEPLYLLAPNDADRFVMEKYAEQNEIGIPFELPTYKNVTTLAFDHLNKEPVAEVCLLYYSGHGSHILAPEGFWYQKPDRQNETWVCVDSRDEGKRDLIDKEIAYLLWKTLKNKPATHCLVITDSCHSGSSTRSAEENDSVSRVRQQPSSRNDIPFQQYLGYNDGGFYKTENGKITFPVARYVHLAACRDSELAQENMAGGLFTRKLVSMIRDGAGAFSYQRLAQSMAVSVGATQQQNPVAFAEVNEDLQLNFLGHNIVAYKKVFLVAKRNGNWTLFAGALHGLGPKAIVRIGNVVSKVVSVSSTTSLLDDTVLTELNVTKQHEAIVVNSGTTPVTIGIGKSLKDKQGRIAALKDTIRQDPPDHVVFDFDQNNNVEYLAQITTDNKYILTTINNTEPLFKRVEEPSGFISDVEKVGKWLNIAALTTDDSMYKASDFIFKVEKIEGEEINPVNINDLKGNVSVVQPDQEHVLSYVNNKQPAVRLTIEIAQSSNLVSCYVGSLYLDHLFGIDARGVNVKSVELVKGGAITISYFDPKAKKLFNAIPLEVKGDDAEILEIVKIIVAPNPFDLESYQQQKLQRDGTRAGFGETNESGWGVFTHRLRILGPKKKIPLTGGTNALNGLTIQVPEKFRATAFAATKADKTRSLDDLGTRSVSISPPASLWEGIITDDAIIGGPSLNNTAIEAIELTPPPGVEAITLKPGEELIVKPTIQRTHTRAIDNDEVGVNIPYGFDEQNGLFFPLGYEDENGEIHILVLPPPSSGTLDGAPATRSLGSSIKLFFKRIFGRKTYDNVKALYEITKDEWKPRAFAKDEDLTNILKEKITSRALLLVHGFTGDTKHMVESLKGLGDLYKEVDWVITYDYENLATPIPDTGSMLYKFLETAGLGQQGMPPLTIIAHSLGGVVNRSFLEDSKNNAVAKHLVLVGAPSGGTEIASLGMSVLGLISHAINVTGPIKLALKGLCLLLRKLKMDPTEVLKELEKKSDVIKQLKKNESREGMKVSVIAGNVALLKDESYDGDDPFMKKIKKSLMDGVIYPGLTWALYHSEPNDMVVTIDSMCDIPYFDALPVSKVVVASGHLSYFREKRIQNELLTYITSTSKGPL